MEETAYLCFSYKLNSVHVKYYRLLKATSYSCTYACVRSVDIFLLHEHSLWEFLSLSLSFLSPSNLFIVSHLPLPVLSCFAWVNSAGYSVGKVGSVGFQIIATQYIDPERHIDRCGRERNNNLHCYCEPIRRNQTGPARSPSCFPFLCILLSRCLAPLSLLSSFCSLSLPFSTLYLSFFLPPILFKVNGFIDSLHSCPSFFTPASTHVRHALCSADEWNSYEYVNDKWQSIGTHRLLSDATTSSSTLPKTLRVDRKIPPTCTCLAVMALSS